MPNASIGGLASGLDTATIISQFMQLESIPQTRLKTKVSSEEAVVKLLQNLNTKFAALATQAKDLTKSSAWTPITATSSHAGVTVKSTSGTSAGTLSFTVNATAAAHQLTFTGTAAPNDVVVPADANGKHLVTLTVAGVNQTIDAGDGTIGQLVGALNAGGTGVSAAALNLDGDVSRLVVQASKTGAANTVSLTAADGSAILGGAPPSTSGADASITIGQDTLTSTTNTFAQVLPGLDLVVSKAAVGQAVDVTVTRDTTAAGTQAKALVDAVNAALTEIDTHTKYNPATKKSGALSGESAVRDLRTALLDAVVPTDGTSLADIGIETDRYGKLVLNAEKFATAYAADAATVTARLSGTTGLAARIEAVATDASAAATGRLTTAITGRTTGIDRLKDSIEQWDTRLELRRTTLTRQFTALETALSRMNSQSSWLAGQIGSLPSSAGS